MQITNGDCIREMTDEELCKVLMCPYDTAGEPIDIMPCIKDGNMQQLISPEDCERCMMDWLRREARE